MAKVGKGAVEKGKRFEREVAEYFSNLTGAKYRRTPLSGGLRFDFPSDLIKTDKKDSVLDGFIIEAKDQAILKMPEWVKQCEGELIDADLSKFVMVIKVKGSMYFVLNQKGIESLIKKARYNTE